MTIERIEVKWNHETDTIEIPVRAGTRIVGFETNALGNGGILIVEVNDGK